MFYSHPNKLLEDHLHGMLENDDNSLSSFCKLYHDIGKININSQNKILGKNFDYNTYSHHSYLSAYVFISVYIKSFNRFKEDFFRNIDINIVMNICVNVIISHHTHLRNINKLFKDHEYIEMVKFLNKDNEFYENAIQFINKNNDLFRLDVLSSDIINVEFIRKFLMYDSKIWQKDALNNFFTTKDVFSKLKLSDITDAMGEIQHNRNFLKKSNMIKLKNNLISKLNSFDTTSEINKIRTTLRVDAKINLKDQLLSNNRVFMLTLPTGSGKTLTSLELAVEISKFNNYQHDIIYCLPYLSIINQINNTLTNDLNLDVYSHTSIKNDTNKNGLSSDELDDILFFEKIFDNNFITTTFNEILETFTSNGVNKQLKIQNFKKRIFIFDEIQALNVNEYSFWFYFIKSFCEKFDSYAIITSATMPAFHKFSPENNFHKIFKSLDAPINLLDPDKIYKNKIFNRYKLNFIGEHTHNSIANTVINKAESNCCVIFNTIDSSYEFYKILLSKEHNFEKIYLLNGHLTSIDKISTIKNISNDIKNNKNILVITTQVIEAGVDLDFNILFTDAAPPPLLNQRGGRCNRNNKQIIGDVYVFLLLNKNNRHDSDYIYQLGHKYKQLIQSDTIIYEKDFYSSVMNFFDKTAQYTQNIKLVDDIYNGNFENINEYKLINEDDLTYNIYIGNNTEWIEFKELYANYKSVSAMNKKRFIYNKLILLQSKIQQNTISIREKYFNKMSCENDSVLGIYKLKNNTDYSGALGLFIIYLKLN